MWHFVNCTSSPEPGAESSADSFSAMCQSAPLNWRNTLGLSSSSGSGTASSPGSQSGMTFGPSTATPGEAESIACAGASPARTSAPPVEAKGSTVPAPASGGSLHGSFVRFDRATSSWKTPHCSLLGDSVPFSGTWPRWGSMRNGACWARTMPAFPTVGSESGSWPTPKARDWRSGGTNPDGVRARINRRRNQGVIDLPDAACLRFWRPGLTGLLNPSFSESLMGWPTGWTACGPLAMDRFLSWLRSHGTCCPGGSEEAA